jgi:hypothetical protein
VWRQAAGVLRDVALVVVVVLLLVWVVGLLGVVQGSSW